MRRKKKKSEDPSSPLWMTTFSDMVTLILVFFVLLYSFSIVDIVKFQQFIASFKGSGILNYGSEPLETPPQTDGKAEEQASIVGDSSEDRDQQQAEFEDVIEENPLVEVYEMVVEYIVQHELQELVEVRFEVRGIALEIKDRILFDSAKADLKPNAKEVLTKLAPLLERLPYMTSVEGHTDNRSINTPQFPSNWELSTARALSVVKYFIEELDLEPKKLAVVGLGEYHPIVPNTGPENWELNRRVIIVINAEDPFMSEVLEDDGTEIK